MGSGGQRGSSKGKKVDLAEERKKDENDVLSEAAAIIAYRNILDREPEYQNPVIGIKTWEELEEYGTKGGNYTISQDVKDKLDFDAVRDAIAGGEAVKHLFGVYPRSNYKYDGTVANTYMYDRNKVGLVGHGDVVDKVLGKKNEIAFSHDGFLSGSTDRLVASLDRSVKSGYHPFGTNAFAVGAHEMTHNVTRTLAKMDLKDLVKRKKMEARADPDNKKPLNFVEAAELYSTFGFERKIESIAISRHNKASDPSDQFRYLSKARRRVSLYANKDAAEHMAEYISSKVVNSPEVHNKAVGKHGNYFVDAVKDYIGGKIRFDTELKRDREGNLSYKLLKR